MKKLIVMMLVLFFPMRGLAYAIPFIIYDDATGTLTFSYGELDPDKLKNGVYGAHISHYWEISEGCYFGPQPIEFHTADVKKIVFRPECYNVKLTSLYQFFYELNNMTEIEGIEYLNTSEVTDMRCMFEGCSSLTSLDLSNFNTSKVTSMGRMFKECSSLTSLDVSNFNTSNVTNMGSMFSGCSSLTSLDVSNFNTSNVAKMGDMFSYCSSLSSFDLSNFNTSNVTDMRRMFRQCSSLTNLDVSNFNTSNVTDMSEMFYNCSSLTSLDLCNFNTYNVTGMGSMFYNCTNLQTIYCNDTWATGHSDMFLGCTNIKGGKGTTYSPSNTSSDYAHPKAGGYFTEKRRKFTAALIFSETQYWSSFYTTTRNVRADDNITVYTATLSSDDDGLVITLNEIADKIVPCGQAVLMRSVVEEPILLTAYSEGTGDYSTNTLKGTQTDIATSSVGGNVFTLASKNGNFGFYRFSGATLNGGKAYLVVDDNATARIAIAGLDEVTGIENIGTNEQQVPCYDLQGRRVSPTRKGIYVINGKKVVK